MIQKIELSIEDITPEQALKYQEIFVALATSGALNLKNGKVILHFDHMSNFQGLQLDYWAVKRRDGKIAEETKKNGLRRFEVSP